MPVNFGVIDLNSDAVSGDPSSDVDGGDVSGPSIRVGESGVFNSQDAVIGGVADRVGDIGEELDSREVVHGARRVEGLVKESLDREMGSINERSEIEGACGMMPGIHHFDLERSVFGSEGGDVNTNALRGKSTLSGSTELENEVRRERPEVHYVGAVNEDLIDVKFHKEKVMDRCLKIEKEEEVVQVAGTDVNRIAAVQTSEVGLSQGTTVRESNIVNLVVDLNPYLDVTGNLRSGALINEERKENADFHIIGNGINGNHDLLIKHVKDVEKPKGPWKQNVKQEASEREFEVSDLVWGKVRSHPWWPGQIFDPSDSSEKAMKYFKKDSFLIAYFGDQTFAWNEAPQLKPFGKHFSQMEKQSNLEAFHHAVDCALGEVARRVEFGLTCSCVPDEVRSKIKVQNIVNAGIREEASRRDGGDRYLNASFEPTELLTYMKTLARSSCHEVDRLKFVIAQAQLSAFHHWKGFSLLPELEMLGGLLGDDENLPHSEAKRCSGEAIQDVVQNFKSDEQGLTAKGKSKGQSSYSQRHKLLTRDSMRPSKKQRSLTDLMAGNPCLLDTEKFSFGKPKEFGTAPDGLAVKHRERSSLIGIAVQRSPKTFSIGDSICRVANQLNGSNALHKSDKPAWYRKSQKRKAIEIECSSPEEMVSQIQLAAKHPMEGYKFLSSSINFLLDFRNFVCLDRPRSLRSKQSMTEGSSNKSENSNSEAIEASESKYVEDSYWTDRIIQSIPGEKLDDNLNETQESLPETKSERLGVSIGPEAALVSKHQIPGGNVEKEAEKPVDHMTESNMEEFTPTALILNFKDLDSIPSETELNRIFSRYGPLNESETEVLKKSSRVKVVFKRSLDAETAFSSSGKFSIFGHSLISYRLKYLPAKPRKASSSATNQKGKGKTAMESNAI